MKPASVLDHGDLAGASRGFTKKWSNATQISAESGLLVTAFAKKGGDMPFRIVRAEPEDWEALRAIRLRSLREEPQAYASSYETEARYPPDLWRERLATAFSYLAFDDDHDLVGIATGLWTPDGDTQVVGMYVAPEARGLGCAHQLLDAIADLAIRRHGKRLVLVVAESNTRATRSYHSYGFIETGRRRLMDRDPSITEIELEYPLPTEQAIRDRR
jgi:ribosomal protein S18 acetylase RimI-like enzyme